MGPCGLAAFICDPPIGAGIQECGCGPCISEIDCSCIEQRRVAEIIDRIYIRSSGCQQFHRLRAAGECSPMNYRHPVHVLLVEICPGIQKNADQFVIPMTHRYRQSAGGKQSTHHHLLSHIRSAGQQESDIGPVTREDGQHERGCAGGYPCFAPRLDPASQ